MVHAGLFADWSLADAQTWAVRAERALQASPAQLLSSLKERSAKRWSDAVDEGSQLATAIAGFSRMRMCRERDGAMVTDFDGHPDEAPPGTRPWFERVRRVDLPVVFGHWSALGLHLTERACCLDTGCVWGRQLTALRLEDRAVFQVDAAERPPSNRSE
jgi:bis(5'-nucleosyl)-tetraphosphatase (symmetrical)